MTSKLIRIISQLQKSKDNGVEEVDLLKDWETSGNARVIRYRINKILGDSNGVVTNNGVWFLDEHYWKMSKVEFIESMNRYTIQEISSRNNLVTISMVAIFSVLLVVAYFLGQPDTQIQCLSMFNDTVTGL